MNIQLTRLLAIFQARTKFLAACSDVFTELSDMKELRKLKGDIEDYIHAQHQKGNVPADPSERVLEEILQIETALEAADSIYKELSVLGDSFVELHFVPPSAQFQPICLADFEASVREFESKLKEMSEGRSALSKLFKSDHWEDGNDANKELITFAKLACSGSKLHTLPRKDLHAFACANGALGGEIERHLDEARASISALRQEYSNATLQWQNAATLASNGDYIQAEKLLNAIPHRIIDDNYNSVREQIVEWKQKADSYRMNPLDGQLAESMKTPPTLDLDACKREYTERLAILDSLDAWANAELSQIRQCSNSDFKQTAEEILLGRQREFALSRTNLAKQYRGRVFQLKALAVGTFVVLLVLAVGVIGIVLKTVLPRKNGKPQPTPSTPASGAQDVGGMLTMGNKYYRAEGVAQDYTEAARWFRKAADSGNATAMCNLGIMYHYGRGVLKDEAEAANWYRKAADLGNAGAMYSLGVLYRTGQGVSQDFTESVQWQRKAADLGDRDAMSELGLAYYRGHGVQQDYGEAMKWFEKAADLGDSDAMSNVGIMYKLGQGVTKDRPKAVTWYRKAAEAGNVDGMHNLAASLYKGEGIVENAEEALKWFRKAADLGDADSIAFLHAYKNESR